MSFSPQSFLSNLNSKGGPAKSNRFEVFIPIPRYLSTFINNSLLDQIQELANTSIGELLARILSQQDNQSGTFNSYMSRYLALQCENAELPGKVLQTADVKIYGPTFKVPYQTMYQDITLSFISSNDFYERKIFDKWLEIIMPTDTNNLRYPKGTETRYLTNLKIIQYDEFVKQIYAVECIDAFPLGISSQPLSWSSDGFHRVSVVFAYQKYKTLYDGNYDYAQLLPALFGDHPLFKNTIL